MNFRAGTHGAKVVVGLLVIVGAGLLYASFLFNVWGQLFASTNTVRVHFANAGGLHRNEPVRLDGVAVGKVSDIAQAPDGEGALVTMEIEDDAGPLYADARATVRWRTLLGANFTVELDRGTPGAGELGGRIIPQRQTAHPVELDDVTRAMTTDARRGLRQMLHELPKVLADPRQPGAALAALGDESAAIDTGMRALLGQRPDRDLRELVRNTGDAMDALNAPRQRLRGLVAHAGATSATTAARSADLADTFTTAASALPHARAALARLDTTLAIATPLLNRLQEPAGEVAPALAALQPVARDADRLLRDRALPLVRSLRPTARSLAAMAKAGVPLIDELEPTLARFEDKILPSLERRSPESQRKTYEMIGPALAGLAGMGGHYDEEGQYTRLLGGGGGRVLDTLPCRTFFMDPSASAHLQCEELSSALQRLFGQPTSRTTTKRKQP